MAISMLAPIMLGYFACACQGRGLHVRGNSIQGRSHVDSKSSQKPIDAVLAGPPCKEHLMSGSSTGMELLFSPGRATFPSPLRAFVGLLWAVSPASGYRCMGRCCSSPTDMRCRGVKMQAFSSAPARQLTQLWDGSAGMPVPSMQALRFAAAEISEHAGSGLFRAATKSLEELTNTRIPLKDGSELLAYCARAPSESTSPAPVLILIHEFFGLSESIVDKAQGLAKELGCVVIAPDTFRGVTSTFIPQCIWLALSTPQDRVNDDLDAVLKWCQTQPEAMDSKKVAVMGFCYGGGKAIRYTTARKPDAATVVCYGSPVTDVAALRSLSAGVCGVFGSLDVQFPPPVLSSFRDALRDANVQPCEVRVYDGVGHAFWKDMQQIQRKQKPQIEAWEQITGFLRRHFVASMEPVS